ncbi:At1g47710 [Linum grandiflorum]
MDDDLPNLRNWGGYYEPSSFKAHLSLQLTSNMTDRDTKHFMPDSNSIMLNVNAGAAAFYPLHPDPHIPYMRDSWLNQRDNKYPNLLAPPNHNYPPYPETSSAHSLQMLPPPPMATSMCKVEEHTEPEHQHQHQHQPKKRNGSVAKTLKAKKPRKPKDPNSNPVQRAKLPKKSMEMVINGIDMDISGIPIPVCSCTGNPQQCYRWGCGGWQSACCTTNVSMYPLPMSTKRRGARIAGRKMSQGAFKKVLEKLAAEGYNFSNPIDLRTHWAKHAKMKGGVASKVKGRELTTFLLLVVVCTTFVMMLQPFERTPPLVEKYVLQKPSGILEFQTDSGLSITKHVLLKELAESSTPKNVVLSPVSIQAVLSLIAAGSNGATRDQLLSFLKANSSDHLNSLSSELVSVISDSKLSLFKAKRGPELSLANGVWVDKSVPLRHSFKQVVRNIHKAAYRQVDFKTKAAEVVAEVNDWADRKTNGLIKNIVPPDAVNSLTRLIFANALYFKGAWNQKFDRSATKDHDFHLLNGGSVRVRFMSSEEEQYVSRFDGFKVLSLPYKQGRDKDDKRRFSMCIFLPDSKTGLPALVEKITNESGFLNRHIPFRKVSLDDFRIPKFKVSFELEASDTLKKLGLVLPFSDEADFTEMVEDSYNGMVVSELFHKSFVEVNEQGAKAGAASVTWMAGSCNGPCNVPKNSENFVADHPFLFFIREDTTGTVLFSGHILDPSQPS